MRHKGFLIGLLAQLITLVSCAATLPVTTYTNPKQSIQINPKALTFKISLAANPTTGYQWQLLAYPKFLRLDSHAYQPPLQAVPGRGGVETWTFTTQPSAFQSSQPSVIKLRYVRPWEDNTYAQAVTFKIKAT